MKQSVFLATLLLALLALGHLLRVVYQFPLIVGSVDIPMWVSILAVFIAGGLALWLWKERGA